MTRDELVGAIREALADGIPEHFEPYCTAQEIASFLGVDVVTVRAMTRDTADPMPHHALTGDRTKRYRKSEVAAWLARRQSPTGTTSNPRPE